MFDPQRLLGQMLGGSLGGDFSGRKGKHKRSGLGLGSLGSIGNKATIGVGLLGVAMAAWEHYSQTQRATTVPNGGAAQSQQPAQPYASHMPPPPPAHAPPPPPVSATPAATPTTRPMPVIDDRQQSVVLLIRAMIAAANADGHIDATERESILGRARDGGLDADTLAFLDAELAKPQTLQQVVANAKPELAADIYAASALAITVDTDAEKQWLDMLSYGLRLDPAVRADIDTRIATA